MTSELFSIYGKIASDGETAGILEMASDVWTGTTEKFRIPKGMTLKIWEEKATTAGTLDLYTEIVPPGAEPIPALTVSALSLQDAGTYTNSRSGRPLVIPSPAGDKAVQLRYENHTDGAFITFNCELAPIE